MFAFRKLREKNLWTVWRSRLYGPYSMGNHNWPKNTLIRKHNSTLEIMHLIVVVIPKFIIKRIRLFTIFNSIFRKISVYAGNHFYIDFTWSKSRKSQNSTTIIRRINEFDPWSKLMDRKSRKATFEIELRTNPLNSLAQLVFEMDITSTEFLVFGIFEWD